MGELNKNSKGGKQSRGLKKDRELNGGSNRKKTKSKGKKPRFKNLKIEQHEPH